MLSFRRFAPNGLLCENMTSSTNRKYITFISESRHRSQIHRQHAQKVGEVRLCGFCHMRADRQTKQTETLVTIFCSLNLKLKFYGTFSAQHPRDIHARRARLVVDILARVSRGCYEENCFVEKVSESSVASEVTIHNRNAASHHVTWQFRRVIHTVRSAQRRIRKAMRNITLIVTQNFQSDVL